MRQRARVFTLLVCIFFLALAVLFLRQAFVIADQETYVSSPLEPLTLTSVDVGKGDALIITCDGEVMLVDTGYKATYSSLKDTLKAQNITRIDHLVLTHFDKDHIGGAAKLLRDFEVAEVLMPEGTGTGDAYKRLTEALKQTGTPVTVAATDSLSFTLGDADCTLYPPLSPAEETDNNSSLVLRIEHGADSYLLAGDAENQRLQEMMGQMPLESLFLKVPHHGKAEALSGAFLRAVAPQYALITCSSEEKPDGELLALLNELGTQVFRSDENGTVTFTGTGTGVLTIE